MTYLELHSDSEVDLEPRVSRRLFSRVFLILLEPYELLHLNEPGAYKLTGSPSIISEVLCPLLPQIVYL